MILVTGGTGFIGTHLLEKLVASGQAVRALVRRTGARPRSLPAGVETVYGDLASGAGIAEALRGTHAVIHLAGVTKALRPGDYYTGNVRATEQLVHAMAGQGIRLVHVSSLAAIGPSEAGVLLAEDAEPHPLTHYGKSKLAAEKVVRDLAPYAVIVRPPVVYGPRDTDVFQLLKSISKGLVLEIAGGERWFSAIYVKDLVDGLLAAAGTPLAAGRTYFLAHAKPVSWRHLGASAARIMARTPRVVTVPFAAPTRPAPAPKSGPACAASRASSPATKLPKPAAWPGPAIPRAPPSNSASWRPRPSTKASPPPWRGTRRPVG